MSLSSENNAAPGVSYLMPVLSEATHIEAALDSILAQDYSGSFDVIVVRGESFDGTDEILERRAQQDSRIRVLENPTGSIPDALNIGLAASFYPIIVRVSARSVLSPSYTRTGVEALLRTDAAEVGGVMRAVGTTDFENAVAIAYDSPLGLIGEERHTDGGEGQAETAYLGVFLREWLTKIGPFDDDAHRGQDWDLGQRLREAGGVVWFTPSMTVTYRPQPSPEDLSRQFFVTGLWRGDHTRRHAPTNPARFFARPIAVLAVLLGLPLGCLGYLGLFAGAQGFGAVVSWILFCTFLLPIGYFLTTVVLAIKWGIAANARTGAALMIVYPSIHFSWGLGFVLGFLRFANPITARLEA
jgi:succinoglycan biosynthesis protein ExoA